MKILLTNDDGLHAPGINAFEAATEHLGDLWVVAPHEERSGASHALTMNAPLRIHAHADQRFSCTGTPVDCVYLAIHSLLGGMPALVLSGINKGANLGDDVLYSGTVGAAREAALNDLPALAVSLATEGGGGAVHFESAASIACQVIAEYVRNPLPPGVFLNLNVPNLPLDQIRGIKICGLGRRHYDPLVEERHDPRQKPYYWIGGAPTGSGMNEETDGWWVARGYASLTPLGLDATQRDQLDSIGFWTLKKGQGK